MEVYSGRRDIVPLILNLYSRWRLAVNFTPSLFVCLWQDSSHWARPSSFTRFLPHTQWRTIVGRTPLDEWSSRRSDLYLTTHNTHNRHTSMPSVEFEPKISAGEPPQTYYLDRADTGTDPQLLYPGQISASAIE